MAPSPFRSTAVVCSIVTASLGFGLLTPTVATAATPSPPTSVAQDAPADSIVGVPVDPDLDAPTVSSVDDTFTGSRAVMGFAGTDAVLLLDGDETVSRWPGGQGLFLLRALDKYRDRTLDLVRVHTAADGTKTRTERIPLPRTLQVDGLRASNRFVPGVTAFRGTASAGASVSATDVSTGTTLFEAEVSSARTAVGSWNADADLPAGNHTVTFTQTLPDGRSSTIANIRFSDGEAQTPAVPVVEPSERRLDGDFTLWGAVDDRTVEVEVRTADGTSIGETRVVGGEFTATVPQTHLGSTVDVVAIAADGSESAVAPVELQPLPTSADVAKPSVREVNVLPNGTVQVIGEVQAFSGAQVLDGDTVVDSIRSDSNGWSVNIGPESTGKQLDLVTLGFDGQRFSATSERVALPRLLQVDGLAAENEYTPGERTFTGSAEAGATVVARDQDGTELFRTEAKQTRSGVAEWEAKADLTSGDGYEVTFTQTTADGRSSVMKDVTFTPQEDDAAPTPQDLSLTSHQGGTFTPGAQRFTGKATPGATVTFNPAGFDPSNARYDVSTTADDSGNWTIERGLADWQYRDAAFRQDVEGDVVKQVKVPLIPEVEDATAQDLTLTSHQGGEFTPGAQRFTGKATPGAKVTFNPAGFGASNAHYTLTTWADTKGNWAIERSLADWTYGDAAFRQDTPDDVVKEIKLALTPKS